MNQLTPSEATNNGRLDRYLPTAADMDEQSGLKISLGDLRAMLWRQRRILIVITIAGVLLGLAVTFLMTPRYAAQVSVRIDNEAVKIVEGQDLDPVVALGDTNRYLNTQKRIVESRNLASTVASRLKLTESNAFIESMGGKLPDADLSPAQQQAMRRATVLALLKDNVEMTVAQDNRISTISFTSRDPELAARIANSYATEFIAQNVQSRYDNNAYARKVLNSQVQEARLQLQATERQAIEYARRNRLIDTGDASSGSDDGEGGGSTSGSARSITTASLIQLNTAYIDARTKRMAAEARWKAAQASNGFDLPDARKDASIQGLMTRRAETMAKLAELRARYQDNQPLVREASVELQEIERQLAGAGRSMKNSIQSEYRAALAEEQSLTAAKEQLADETLTEQDRRVQLNLIARDAETQRRQLNDLLTRLNQINSAADITANNVSMLDQALVPTAPVSPDFKKNLIISLAAALAVAFLVAFAREALDDTLRSPEDAERKLDLSLLGTTPYISDMTAQDIEERQGELSEAYYSIRATVDYASSGATKKSFLVTSSQPGEGKSTTSIALARDFARIGRRVLLIDADLRNPSLHRTMGLPKEVGLIDVLMNMRSFEECRYHSDVHGLDLLPLGTIPPNPVQILSSDLIPDFLARVSENYDVVVLDSAPVMGLADAPMLSRMVDHVVLIVEANRAHYGQAKSAVRRLQDAGARILGIVMTKFSFRDAGYSYDYHYSYYSYRSKQSQEVSSA